MQQPGLPGARAESEGGVRLHVHEAGMLVAGIAFSAFVFTAGVLTGILIASL